MDDLPTTSRLKQVGKAMVRGDMTEDQQRDLLTLLHHADAVATEATNLMATRLLTYEPARGGGFTVRGRAKSRDTLLAKLVERGGEMLPRIRDVAGVRVVGNLLLHEQDEVMTLVCRELSQDPPKLIDRRSDPVSGYRALHAEVKVQGIPLEVQVRTSLQAVWAELYEKLGDQWGRQIRYGGVPNEMTVRSPSLHQNVAGTIKPVTPASLVASMQLLAEAVWATDQAWEATHRAEEKIAEARAKTNTADEAVRAGLGTVAKTHQVLASIEQGKGVPPL